MAMNEPIVATWSPGGISSSSVSPKQRHDTMVMVQWTLAIACAYLVLFSSGSPGEVGLGALVIVAFLAANLVVGRLSPDVVSSAQGNLGVAALDTILIIASLYVASQLSVELIVLSLGILLLTVAGLRLGAIAAASAGLMVVYVLMVALFSGTESLERTSTLLRVAFLFTAAITYAWLVEVGRNAGADARTGAVDDMAQQLSAQRDTIARCQRALSDGATDAAHSALRELAGQNQSMMAKVARR